MALDLHRRECPLEQNCEALDTAARQLVLMETYLQRFLTLGRPKPQAIQLVDLTRLINDLLPLVRPACAHGGIDLNGVCHGEPVLVAADAAGLEQMFINLLLNAVEAAGSEPLAGGNVTVEFGRTEGDQAVVSVRDSGPGPAAAIADRIFEPLVSEKPDGAGLGLTVARQIAEEHGGSLTWERQGAVTCFVARLPIGMASQVAPAAAMLTV
jgi:signal transduction histidine kinase